MACSKYTLTNTGTTSINFNYRRCDDSMWEYQVNLDPNQTKNIWLINGTYQIAESFQTNVSLVNDGAYPLTPTPTPTTTTTPTPTTTTTPTPSITPTTTVTPTVTSTVTPTTTVTPTVTSTVTPTTTTTPTTTVTPTVTSTNTPTPSITPTTTVTPTITSTPTPTSTPVGPGSMVINTGYMNMSPGFTASTSDFSVEFWYKSSDTSQYSPILGSPYFNNNSLAVYIDSGGNYLQITKNSSGSSITFQLPTPLQADTWTYFAISRSGTTESVWVDGVASPDNTQSDNRDYSGATDGIFITGGLLGTANVTNIKVNIGATYLDPTLSTITVPTNSLTANAQTKLLMNALNAGGVLTDSSSTQSSITVATGSIIYSINSPY